MILETPHNYCGVSFLNDNETRDFPLLSKTKMKPLLILFLLPLLLICQPAKSQSITEKDFRLMIDGKTYTDSTNLITVSELLKMKEVSANFSWINIKSIVIYYQPYCEAQFRRCSTNFICGDAKDLMKRLKPGNTLVISIDEAVNRQGIKVHIKDLVFGIK